MILLNRIKKIVAPINKMFIAMVLAVFYVVILGISALIFKIFFTLKQKGKVRSHWEKSEVQKYDLDYFRSSY